MLEFLQENTDLTAKLKDIEFYEGDNPVEEVKTDESELNYSSEEEEEEVCSQTSQDKKTFTSMLEVFLIQ